MSERELELANYITLLVAKTLGGEAFISAAEIEEGLPHGGIRITPSEEGVLFEFVELDVEEEN